MGKKCRLVTMHVLAFSSLATDTDLMYVYNIFNIHFNLNNILCVIFKRVHNPVLTL